MDGTWMIEAYSPNFYVTMKNAHESIPNLKVIFKFCAFYDQQSKQ